MLYNISQAFSLSLSSFLFFLSFLSLLQSTEILGKLAAYGTDLRIYDGSTLQPLLQVGGQSVKKPQPRFMHGMSHALCPISVHLHEI